MTIQLHLNPTQIKDFAGVRELGPEVLAELLNSLTSLKEPPVTPKDLLSYIHSKLAGDAERTECLVRQLLSLAGLGRQGGHSASEVVDGVGQAIVKHADWNPTELEGWASVSPVLAELLQVPAVRLTATTIELSYDYSYVLRRARILTDVRPLFSEDGEQVEAAVVSQTMRLRYDDINGEREMSIAVDEADIRDLMQQCDRALKKAAAAQRQFAVPGQLPVIITGGGQDEDAAGE